MPWKIEFYDEKVEDSIKDWPKGIKAKFLWLSNVIEQFGPAEIGTPHIEPMGKGLFEIRVKASE
jgi:hypothetical protein